MFSIVCFLNSFGEQEYGVIREHIIIQYTVVWRSIVLDYFLMFGTAVDFFYGLLVCRTFVYTLVGVVVYRLVEIVYVCECL